MIRLFVTGLKCIDHHFYSNIYLYWPLISVNQQYSKSLLGISCRFLTSVFIYFRLKSIFFCISGKCMLLNNVLLRYRSNEDGNFL